MPKFHVCVNKEGWGPMEKTLNQCVPRKFIIKPFAPFSRADKLGRVADFTRRRRYNRDKQENEQDSGFVTVDTVNVSSKKKWIHRRVAVAGDTRQGRNFNRQRQRRGPNEEASQGTSKRPGQSRFNIRKNKWIERRMFKQERKTFFTREPSVKIEPEWTFIHQIELKDLTKLSAPKPSKIDDFLWCGHLEYVNPAYGNMLPRASKPLERTKREFYHPTTIDDENIEEFATEGKGNVFATDSILAHLMTCSRSNLPWDAVIKVFGEGENKVRYSSPYVSSFAPIVLQGALESLRRLAMASHVLPRCYIHASERYFVPSFRFFADVSDGAMSAFRTISCTLSLTLLTRTY